MGLLAWHLKDVKPIDPASIPEERRTFLSHGGYLDGFAERMARDVRVLMRRQK